MSAKAPPLVASSLRQMSHPCRRAVLEHGQNQALEMPAQLVSANGFHTQYLDRLSSRVKGIAGKDVGKAVRMKSGVAYLGCDTRVLEETHIPNGARRRLSYFRERLGGDNRAFGNSAKSGLVIDERAARCSVHEGGTRHDDLTKVLPFGCDRARVSDSGRSRRVSSRIMRR